VRLLLLYSGNKNDCIEQIDGRTGTWFACSAECELGHMYMNERPICRDAAIKGFGTTNGPGS
jgi:hypothetical protein